MTIDNPCEHCGIGPQLYRCLNCGDYVCQACYGNNGVHDPLGLTLFSPIVQIVFQRGQCQACATKVEWDSDEEEN